MGIIINKTAIAAAALTAACLYFGIKPVYAFLMGAIILLTPLRFIFPGGDKKIISETGIMSGLGVMAGFTTLGFGLLYSFLFGVTVGYAYVVWWVLIMPKILK